MTKSIGARTTQLLASVAIGTVIVTATPLIGAWPQTAAQAQVTISAEFRTALSPYGRWQRHPRWGEVWIVNRQAEDWRPYTRGRWVYTDDWGYYWDTDAEEADWGWVAYHYGRWVNDPGMGWIWIAGDDWGPAWVDWRRGDDYVGWAPLPPDEFIVEYRNDPVYWSFVRPRYLLAPRVFRLFVPRRERVVIIRRTVLVNRTVILDRRDRDRRGRVAVNAGIDPGLIARAQGRPIRAAKVEPAVLAGTKIDGGREVKPGERVRPRASVKETNVVIKPSDKVEPPKELGANEKGRLGDRPPKAAQNDNDRGNNNRGDRDRDNNPGANNTGRSGDTGRSPPPPPPAVNNVLPGASPPPPPPPGARPSDRRTQPGATPGGERPAGAGSAPSTRPQAPAWRDERSLRLQSPPPPPRVLSPPPPPAVRRAPPPPPPPAAVRRAPPPPPPPAAVRQAPPPPPAAKPPAKKTKQQEDDERKKGR